MRFCSSKACSFSNKHKVTENWLPSRRKDCHFLTAVDLAADLIFRSNHTGGYALRLDENDSGDMIGFPQADTLSYLRSGDGLMSTGKQIDRRWPVGSGL